MQKLPFYIEDIYTDFFSYVLASFLLTGFYDSFRLIFRNGEFSGAHAAIKAALELSGAKVV